MWFEMSHLTQVRGLKHLIQRLNMRLFVAPHAGAWIETINSEFMSATISSHLTQVRGLKLKS